MGKALHSWHGSCSIWRHRSTCASTALLQAFNQDRVSAKLSNCSASYAHFPDNIPGPHARLPCSKPPDACDYWTLSFSLLPHCRVLIPMHKDLRLSGQLPPLDAPHHMRATEWGKFREGVVLSSAPGAGSLLDIGLDKVSC